MECKTSLTDMEEVSNFSSRLKHDVQAVCTKLALLGEESVLLSVKLADKSSKYVGSPLGKAFLLKRLDILEDFYQFCKCCFQSFII
ncbi:hypothetical protein KUTeg_010539 [Tegillarca granosa]|uniref:Uncharacterized protein n=1 Tax=Tegillarca granosa TaxID=220873 RepID=A0ABQ9F5S8_TEGGR|nr:hypothetical protein KUTeg_010533 [Tegillarca granosa]KAJ8311932.1 hypothetical protein KUTeg_010539 [Tegillarca granosa]